MRATGPFSSPDGCFVSQHTGVRGSGGGGGGGVLDPWAGMSENAHHVVHLARDKVKGCMASDTGFCVWCAIVHGDYTMRFSSVSHAYCRCSSKHPRAKEMPRVVCEVSSFFFFLRRCLSFRFGLMIEY